MQKRLLEPTYRFKPPRPSAAWQRLLAYVPRRMAARRYRVMAIDLHGEEHVRAALDASDGVMFTVNHPAHGDPFMIFEAMRRLTVSCCYMAGWQVLEGWWGFKSFFFQRMGVFSVDREGTDMRSFRVAVDLLFNGRHPLVIFPEGDVYHLNGRVTPLRGGAAMIAVTADRRRRKQDRAPVRIVPCAIRYRYTQDPTAVLEAVMDELERFLSWRPRTGVPLWDRIYRFADAALALKEIEYRGTPGQGPLPPRITTLIDDILAEMEQRNQVVRGGRATDDTVPLRVKNLRNLLMNEAWPNEHDKPPVALGDAVQRDLDDLHLVTQLFSYPGDYVAERPSIDRIAETIDKFEEDLLGAVDAGARADRRADVVFGPSIEVESSGGSVRKESVVLTAEIEKSMQGLLE